MNPPSRLGVPMVLSVLLHVLFGLLLLYAAHDSEVSAPAPISVELWSGAPPAPPRAVVVKTVTPPVVQPPAPPEEQPKADVQLGRRSQARRQEASLPRSTSKPEKTVVASTPPAKTVGKKTARHYTDDTSDLLAGLGKPSGHPANAPVTQAGAPNGTPGGAANGSAQARDNYAADVQNRIRPFVVVPPDLSGNPKAIVQVLLWPTLGVRDVKLLKSSGNAAYDDAVQRAVLQAQTFPPLPAGANFSDYRELTLVFRPK